MWDAVREMKYVLEKSFMFLLLESLGIMICIYLSLLSSLLPSKILLCFDKT